MSNNLWQNPTGTGAQQLYDWAKRLTILFQKGRHKDYLVRSITLSAGTSTVVAWSGMSADHRVSLTPTNSAAAALSPYVSARTAGTGFTIAHGSAAGTETFDAIIIR